MKRLVLVFSLVSVYACDGIVSVLEERPDECTVAHACEQSRQRAVGSGVVVNPLGDEIVYRTGSNDKWMKFRGYKRPFTEGSAPAWLTVLSTYGYEGEAHAITDVTYHSDPALRTFAVTITGSEVLADGKYVATFQRVQPLSAGGEKCVNEVRYRLTLVEVTTQSRQEYDGYDSVYNCPCALGTRP